MTRVFLLRHLPVALEPGICYGASDVPAQTLAPAMLADHRARLPVDARILSSPLSRCRTLAEALAPPGTRVHLDARLQEIDFGDWEMQPFDAIDRRLIDAWAADPWNFVPPGGESAQHMSQRVLAGLHDALADAPETLLVISHGGPLRVIHGHLLGCAQENWLTLPCHPGSLHDLGSRQTRLEKA